MASLSARDKDFLGELLLYIAIDAPGDAKAIDTGLFCHGTSEKGGSEGMAIIRLSRDGSNVYVVCPVDRREL